MTTLNPYKDRASTPAAITPTGLMWRIARLRSAPHLQMISARLMLAASGAPEAKRTIVQCPTGHGKSTVASIWYPFWYLTAFPERQVIICSHTDQFAKRWGHKVRDLVQRYGREFGIGVRPGRSAANSWEIVDHRGRPTGGEFVSAGRKGGILGLRADLFLTDDIIKNEEEAYSEAYREETYDWVKSVAQTRCKPDAAMVHVGHPWHSQDLYHRLMDASEQGGDEWTLLRFPALSEGPGTDPLQRPEGEALWPSQWSRERLLAIQEDYRVNGLLKFWNALYQLRPSLGDGESTWKDHLFPADIFYDTLPQRNYVRGVLAIDPSKGASKKSAFQALVHSYKDTDNHFWVDADLVRLDPTGLFDLAVKLIEERRTGFVVVETNNMGFQLFDRLWHHKFTFPVAVLGREHTSKEHKETRIEARLDSLLQRGALHFSKAAGSRLLVQQLKGFPNDYMDGPDALEMGLEFHWQKGLPPGHQLKLVNYRGRPTYG